MKRSIRGLKEKCEVQITTSNEYDYLDLPLKIEFLTGALKGMKYVIIVNIQTYQRID